MKFSVAFIAAALLSFSANVSAEDFQEDVKGTSNGVEFPFSEDAIIEAVALAEDIAPIVLNDSVFFINTTIADDELAAKGLSKRDADAAAEAWKWRTYYFGQPFGKREAEADAAAEAWKWKSYYFGQPFGKREEPALSKREAEADAAAEAWKWKSYYFGQPFGKREE